MPQEHDGHLIFKSGDLLDSTSTDPEAAKVWLAGAATNAEVVAQQNSTAEDPVSFRISTTTWTTILSTQGSTTKTQICGINFGNMATDTETIFEWRFGSSGGKLYQQPLAAAGGAFNHNFIGGKPLSGNNEAVQARLHTSYGDGDVWGSIIFQKR